MIMRLSRIDILEESICLKWLTDRVAILSPENTGDIEELDHINVKEHSEDFWLLIGCSMKLNRNYTLTL